MHLFLPYKLTVVDENGHPADVSYEECDAAGFDIKSTEEVFLHPGCRAAIKTGLFIKKVFVQNEFPEPGAIDLIPEIQIRPRSGLALKQGITVCNSPGTVDASYAQEIMVILLNTSTLFTHHIKIGDRIAQGVQSVTMRCPNIVVKDKIRQGGFGSTGQ